MKKLFSYALLLGFIIATIYSFYLQYQNRPKEFKPITSGIFLSEQISEKDFRHIVKFGIKTIIDMRPDGEAADQTTSLVIKRLSDDRKIDFVYNPIPHGEIPEHGISSLSKSIKDCKKPILMYCRSGKRAIRTYCLSEADRFDGPTKDELLLIVKETGFDASDLNDLISNKIKARIK